MMHTWQLLTPLTLEENQHQKLHCPPGKIYCRTSVATGLTYHPSFLPLSLMTDFPLKAEEAWALEASLEPLCLPSLAHPSFCLSQPCLFARRSSGILKSTSLLSSCVLCPFPGFCSLFKFCYVKLLPNHWPTLKNECALILPFVAGPRAAYHLW